MDINFAVNILLWIHLIALAGAGVAAFGLPVVGSKMPVATQETRPLLMAIANGLANIGRIAVLVLLITGPLMFWLRYGWVAPNVWFWVKMALVVLLLAAVIYATMLANRAQKGDTAAMQTLPQVRMVTMLVFVLTVFSAVFAFN